MSRFFFPPERIVDQRVRRRVDQISDWSKDSASRTTQQSVQRLDEVKGFGKRRTD